MSIIQTLRDKSWIAVVFVLIAMVAFILGDLFGPNSMLLGNNKQLVGEIAGEDVTLQEYQAKVDELTRNMAIQNGGTPPSEAQMPAIREQAWNQLIFEKAYQKQFEALGLEVTADEQYDMVQGNNIHPWVRQSFSDPETGEFDGERIRTFLSALKAGQVPPEQQMMWLNFESQLIPNRLQTKYENLLTSTNYITKAEAQREYQKQSAKASLRYVYVPYRSVADSTIQVSDSDLNAYLKAHASEFKQEDTRTFDYVVFPLSASKEDSAAVYRELAQLKEEFKQAVNDSVFAVNNSDVSVAPRLVMPSELPTELADASFTLQTGEVYGPFTNGNALALYKIGETDETGESYVRASHILIKPAADTDADKQLAKKEARRILGEIKGGASFAEMARQYGTDGTATRGGDLGWFGKGRMVKPFEDAVFAKQGTGLLNDVVETNFGYHIIEVTQPQDSKRYKLYTVQRELEASEGSREQVYREASRFAGTATGAEAFDRLQEENPAVNRFTASRIQKNAQYVNNISGRGARDMIRWAFNDAQVGDVSGVFEADDQYIVAVLTGKTEAGTPALADVRSEVESEVIKEKKAEQIKARLKEISEKDLDAIAKAYGSGATVNSANDVTLGSGSLPGIGVDPLLLGAAFALEPNNVSQPVAGDNGVAILEVTSKEPAAEIADYNTYKGEVEQRLGSRTQYAVSQVIREKSDIEDERVKYF
ncbi:peptidyl-prolyl cis-trans isomerase D [Catalinimonas alkaloidigena]|uniref:Periplasmic chaperone PpiD n=1 Tax=Catalinimonas alkaloidigena TaxID=1075417 RepID=A0A1G9EW74_9BACT|nr:SurA N-terminal domain-containing protein [Catalinimonas alkaloidigena]SDK80298.1 peptidyl-prolyl cis-trans isomerase D [Catalinimonas alkaloidigena]